MVISINKGYNTLMDIRAYNRDAWNRAVDEGNVWTIPVSAEMIAKARQGIWQIVLTPQKPVPRDWFPADLHGVDVLCLASGGGQQAPILAAAGGNVTVFDNSPRQLYQDRKVARREQLNLRAVEGDMRDLTIFPDASFDLVVHPVSNIFVPEILPVWKEAYRVLRPGGSLLSGILNPLLYIFDRFKMDDERELIVRYKLPYSDMNSPSKEEIERTVREGWPFEFSHTLEEQIGGQIQAGFMITGFYEDHDPYNPLDEYIPLYIATRAEKRAVV